MKNLQFTRDCLLFCLRTQNYQADGWRQMTVTITEYDCNQVYFLRISGLMAVKKGLKQFKLYKKEDLIELYGRARRIQERSRLNVPKAHFIKSCLVYKQVIKMKSEGMEILMVNTIRTLEIRLETF